MWKHNIYMDFNPREWNYQSLKCNCHVFRKYILNRREWLKYAVKTSTFEIEHKSGNLAKVYTILDHQIKNDCNIKYALTADVIYNKTCLKKISNNIVWSFKSTQTDQKKFKIYIYILINLYFLTIFLFEQFYPKISYRNYHCLEGCLGWGGETSPSK